MSQLYPQTDKMFEAEPPPQRQIPTAPFIHNEQQEQKQGEMGYTTSGNAGGMHPAEMKTMIVMQGTPTQFGPHATLATCPSCHEQRLTRIEHANSTKTHLIAVILCLTTCCCCIPYCIDSCKNANHYCSSCGAYLGTYGN